jgi:hypothetical protein
MPLRSPRDVWCVLATPGRWHYLIVHPSGTATKSLAYVPGGLLEPGERGRRQQWEGQGGGRRRLPYLAPLGEIAYRKTPSA